MAIITKQDTDGTRGDLAIGELGLDNTGNDDGRIFVGTASGNIPLAKLNEVGSGGSDNNFYVTKDDHIYTKDEAANILKSNFMHINTTKKRFEYLDKANNKWLTFKYREISTDTSINEINTYVLPDTLNGGFNIRRDDGNYRINDGTHDVYDGGNKIKIDNVRLSYATAIHNTGPLMIFKLENINKIRFDGDNGADGGGNVAIDDRTININGTDVNYASKHISNGRGGDPTINHIVLSMNPVDDHAYSNSTNDDYDEYTWDSSEDIVYLIIYWCSDTSDTTCLTDEIIQGWFG